MATTVKTSNGLQDKLEQVMIEVCEAKAELVLARAKSICPVDTGTLQASIVKEAIDNGNRVGSRVDYAGYVEHGTRYQHAQPYLRPALDSVTR